MDLYQLRTFFHLARVRNYSKCAKRLFVTQSAISHAIKKLEDSLDAKLVEKSGKKFSLTDEGKILFRSCEKIFSEIDHVESELDERASRPTTVKIGVTVEFGLSILIKHISKFLDENPDILVDYTLSSKLLSSLQNDEVDLMIDCNHHLDPELLHHKLFREEYVVIASPKYLKMHKIHSPRDLQHTTILSIDKDLTWWNNFTHSLPLRDRVDFDNVTEINHIRGIINCAIYSMGVGFVPRYSVVSELKSNKLVDVFSGMSFEEDYFYLYTKRARVDISRINKLYSFIKGIKPKEFM
jgi:DNA-binding transcriptional LysR family regulator